MYKITKSTDCGHIASWSVSLLITAMISLQAIAIVCCIMVPPKIDLSSESAEDEAENDLNEAFEIELVPSGSFVDFVDSHKRIKWKRFYPKNWLIDKDKITTAGSDEDNKAKKEKSGLLYTCRKYWKSLIFMGMFGFGLNWVRRTRKMILTFRGVELGLSQGDIGTVNSVSFIPDFAMFMVAGCMMDKYGRKSTAIPSLTLFVIGLVSIAFTNSFWTLIIIALIFGFADGFTAGLLMTSSMDVAPKECRAEFLSLFRMFVKFPIIICPTVIGTLCTHVSLFSAGILGAVIGTISLIWIAFVLEDPAKTAEKREQKELEQKMNQIAEMKKKRENNGCDAVVIKENNKDKDLLSSQLLSDSQVTIN